MSKLLKRIFIIGVVLLAIFFIATKIFENGKYVGSSMEPTINMNKNKLFYTTFFFPPLKKGDIVLYELDNSLFPKRIVGLEGDRIFIKDNNLFVNDIVYDFPGKGMVKEGSFLAKGNKIIVPQNSFFLIGDNPVRSVDSRHFGFVEDKKIKGKVLFIK